MYTIMRNGQLHERHELAIPQGSGLIYEVIRIMDQTPLFFHEHYDRFINTASSSHIDEIPSKEDFRGMVDAFTQKMPKKDYNIKVIFERENGDLYIFENPSSYPTPELYERGIHTELMVYVRDNPQAKITNNDLTARANALREKTRAYEVLLVDSDGNITEGSRSNVFFIGENGIVTPPLNSVLPGVTRKLIIETCQKISLPVIETDINSDDIHNCKAAFISGTSPKILPIRSIGEMVLNSSELPILKKLMTAFDETISLDLDRYRKS